MSVGECPDCLRAVRVLPTASVGLVEALPSSGPGPELAGEAATAAGRMRVRCEGPRFPVHDAGMLVGGPVGGACLLAPVAYWCPECLRGFKALLAGLP